MTGVVGPSDKVEYFSCVFDLVEKSHLKMDLGFILITEDEALKLNPGLLPEDYYLIRMKEGAPLL